MLRAVEPFNKQVKIFENRRDQENRKRTLEIELIAARNAETEQV